MSLFSPTDIEQLTKNGITEEKVLSQIETFKAGIPFVKLEKAAVIGDGILKFSDKEKVALIALFNGERKNNVLLKFVPASGAASRMFKALFHFLEDYHPEKETLADYFEQTNNKVIINFTKEIKRFPFYKAVKKTLNDKPISEGEEIYAIVQKLLGQEAFNYGFYPKGLLPFHQYKKETATPFVEHLREAALYASNNGNGQLHFTISKQHKTLFHQEFNAVQADITKETQTTFEVDYSFQKASTDTLAVDMENQPFRNSDDSLLFRPGGHGALIENLNEQEADIIFIKNIDNVATKTHINTIADYKKILAGHLLKVQQIAFNYARSLEQEEHSVEALKEIRAFLESQLNARFPSNFLSFSIAEQIAILKDKINRPIRVCGMVKNEGEPGGGPFWILDDNENISLQIVESAQIDGANDYQSKILQNATHFNPVDLVCGVRNYKGEKYNLLNFVDTKQGFITQKTKEGKDLKALELPGLWNGAMAFWNTIFVEVPLLTFNPVKTVNDLLKPAHQA